MRRCVGVLALAAACRSNQSYRVACPSGRVDTVGAAIVEWRASATVLYDADGRTVLMTREACDVRRLSGGVAP